LLQLQLVLLGCYGGIVRPPWRRRLLMKKKAMASFVGRVQRLL
jgi:hypothetical protein